MKTFVRIAEVWVPSADGQLLEPGGGIYDAAPAFGAATAKMCFGRAEGLPGHAWDRARPLLLSPLDGGLFVRARAAREADLRGALALPIFLRGRLTSVAVLFFGEGDTHVGAVELWHNDARITGDLTLEAGYFGNTDPALEQLSRDAWLPRGSGAPGLAWQRTRAVMIDAIASNAHFLRAQVGAQAGIVRALSLPLGSNGSKSWVVSLLSSATTPIARRVEGWLPDESGAGLRRAFGHCEVRGRLAAADGAAVPFDRLGAIGQAAALGEARVSPVTALAGVGDIHGAGLHSLIALPIVDGDAVSEVVALYF